MDSILSSGVYFVKWIEFRQVDDGILSDVWNNGMTSNFQKQAEFLRMKLGKPGFEFRGGEILNVERKKISEPN